MLSERTDTTTRDGLITDICNVFVVLGLTYLEKQ